MNDWATNEDELAAAALDEDEVDASLMQLDAAAHQLVDRCTTMRRMLYQTLGISDRPVTAACGDSEVARVGFVVVWYVGHRGCIIKLPVAVVSPA